MVVTTLEYDRFNYYKTSILSIVVVTTNYVSFYLFIFFTILNYTFPNEILQ
ncbi:hypothetical protein LEP1GSC008_4568 [Leptospira kirschneri serovar Bulgarica str. Nikolaevo]|uniref:Uncharacterized protein n=1 Tax=Leptospira kirschneri serovar Bulgarica str. Nikolaevo TaxID=1240687 RepID=M6FIT9_9LEPT|nr:hypothetical protein LEP1GSC008_4568 [Leptospira kirschneri serovar Bulgarica str. Nikolaevo]